MAEQITTVEELDALLAVAGEEAEPVVVREGFRVWTLTEDENGEWWAWSWREEDEDGKPRRANTLRPPLVVLHAPGLVAAHDRQVAERARAEALRDAAVALYADETAERGTTKAVRHAIYAAWLLARADSLAPRPAAPGMPVTGVNAEQVEAAIDAAVEDADWNWEPGDDTNIPTAHEAMRPIVEAAIRALGVTVTDGGAL